MIFLPGGFCISLASHGIVNVNPDRCQSHRIVYERSDCNGMLEGCCRGNIQQLSHACSLLIQVRHVPMIPTNAKTCASSLTSSRQHHAVSSLYRHNSALSLLTPNDGGNAAYAPVSLQHYNATVPTYLCRQFSRNKCVANIPAFTTHGAFTKEHV